MSQTFATAPAPPCLLLVEDSAALAQSLSRGFHEAGFAVNLANAGRAALRAITERPVDAVVLDLGLPDLDGLEILARIRASGVQVPILVLTARDAVQSRVEALDAGADDYLLKPFAFEELLARIRALLRRAGAPRQRTGLVLGALSLDSGEPIVQVKGQPVRLSPREHGLLEYLLRHADETVARRDLLSEVFGYDFDPGTNLIDVHVSHLRRKLAGAGILIETVRGFGYRLRREEPRHG